MMTVKKEMGARCPATVRDLVPLGSPDGRPSHRLPWPTVAEIFLIITQDQIVVKPKRSFLFSFLFFFLEIPRRFFQTLGRVLGAVWVV